MKKTCQSIKSALARSRLSCGRFSFILRPHNGPEGYQVRCEDNRVDISIRRKDYTGFLEIKPADSAQEAIRLALGQLLEYAHYPETDKAQNLVVVSDAAPGSDDERYIQKLQQRYDIPLCYVHWPKRAQEISSGELAKCVEVPGRKS